MFKPFILINIRAFLLFFCFVTWYTLMTAYISWMSIRTAGMTIFTWSWHFAWRLNTFGITYTFNCWSCGPIYTSRNRILKCFEDQNICDCQRNFICNLAKINHKSKTGQHIFSHFAQFDSKKIKIILTVPPELNINWSANMHFLSFRGILMCCTS